CTSVDLEFVERVWRPSGDRVGGDDHGTITVSGDWSPEIRSHAATAERQLTLEYVPDGYQPLRPVNQAALQTTSDLASKKVSGDRPETSWLGDHSGEPHRKPLIS